MTRIDNTDRITAQRVIDSIVNLKQLVFEVTNDCNLACKYCIYGEFYSGFDHQKTQSLSFSDAKAIIDYVVGIWKSYPALAYNQNTLISFYGGEPLLNISLIKQIVDYTEQLDVARRFSYAMTSNCVLLDRYADYLVEKRFLLLCSLDGNKESNAYRVNKDGRPSFERVFSNIQHLREQYPEYFREYVAFNSVLHNLNDVSHTNSFFKEMFDKTPTISELNAVGVKPEQKATFMATFKNMFEALNQSEDYEELSRELGSQSPEVHETMCYIDSKSDSIYSSYCDLFHDDDVYKCTPSGTCLPFSKKMFVTVDGKILQCERIHHAFAFGQIRNGVVDLNPERIAETFNSYLDKIQPRCSACARKKSCLQCMFQMSGIESDHPKCAGFMTKEMFCTYEQFCRAYLYHHPELYRRVLKETVYE